MTELTVRAPLKVPRDLVQVEFGNDAVIRVENPSKQIRRSPDLRFISEREKFLTGSSCRTGCPTKSHRSYAECARGLSINTGEVYTRDRAWDRELDAYDDAVAAGIQPAGTSMAEVDRAVRISDATGVAYDAEKPWQ